MADGVESEAGVPRRRKRARSLSSSSRRSSSSTSSSSNSSSHDPATTELRVEGVMHDGQLYLRDLNSDAVFSSDQRDAEGEHVRVGTWNAKARRVVFDAAVKPQKAPRFAPSEGFAFAVTDPDDLAETSELALRDIVPTLRALRGALGRKRDADLALYDPYFCTGRIKTLLGEMGFVNVHNDNVDCYLVPAPAHDVLITNPPYSADHIPRLLDRVSRSDAAPALLLLPNWCVGKYASQLRGRVSFYVTPRDGSRRNSFHKPHGVPGLAVGRTSPFPTFWFVFAGQHASTILGALENDDGCDEGGGLICRSAHDVPPGLLESRGVRLASNGGERHRRDRRGRRRDG